MSKIVLCPHPERDYQLEITSKVYDMLTAENVEAVVCPLGKLREDTVILENMKFGELEADLRDAQMVIAFGGDGTILQVARLAAEDRVPILGVNLGKKGFMAELERDNIDLILKAVKEGYTKDRRMMLDVVIERDGEIIYSDFVLNDVVVGGIARVIDITVYSDGEEMISFSGDGIVVATPTGSTAYSMSAGGPIVEPAAEAIIVTPICPHILVAKPYVLAPEREVTVEIGQLGNKTAYISDDGAESIFLKSGDRIKVKRAAYKTHLVRIAGTSFYEQVGRKLGDRR